jgi:hypothetical protein
LYAVNATTMERRIFALRDAIDGGELVLVIPSLGGVVRLPSGSFGLYPIGLAFTERVYLSARTVDDLPSAILRYQADLKGTVGLDTISDLSSR